MRPDLNRDPTSRLPSKSAPSIRAWDVMNLNSLANALGPYLAAPRVKLAFMGLLDGRRDGEPITAGPRRPMARAMQHGRTSALDRSDWAKLDDACKPDDGL